MLKFYFHPLSPLARRVWLTLLEKQIPFEPIVVNLDQQEQFTAEFLAISPFHHVPAIVDDDVRVIESLAILEYLELRYPAMPLVSTELSAITQMRMVQMVTVNELMPNLLALINSNDQPLTEANQQRLNTVWQFLGEQLDTKNYFGGDRLNLADIVAGAAVNLFHRLGVSLQDYPALDAWRQRVADRPAWRETEPAEPSFQLWQRWLRLHVKRLAKSR